MKGRRPVHDNLVEEQRKRPSSLTGILPVLAPFVVLIAGSIAWWGCHYLLLWNAEVAASDALVAGYDSRFMLSVGGTVVALGALALASHRRPGFEFARWLPSYGAFLTLSIIALILVFAPLFAEEPAPLIALGAVLSGIGNSFALVIYGELHAQMELRVLPLVFALEALGGIALFLPSLAFPPAALPASLALAVICALCFLRSSRTPGAIGSALATAGIDMGLRALVVLAILTGIGYGMARTFTVGAASPANVFDGLLSEWIGSSCAALFLITAFFLQKRLSMFELCLLFVVPFVATGLLLASLRGSIAIVPAAINHAGFACFFILMWYFAAMLSAHDGGKRLTFTISILFLANQASQFTGSLVPAQFSNMLSMSLVYLILVVSMGFMYWRSKTNGARGTQAAGTATDNISNAAGNAQPWIAALGLSPREAEIAALLLKRTPYRQISEELFISENTVKTHVRNIYKKSNVTSREELLEMLATLGQDA